MVASISAVLVKVLPVSINSVWPLRLASMTLQPSLVKLSARSFWPIAPAPSMVLP